MNKISLFTILLLTLNFGFGQSDIIISQYIETSVGSTPKGIEIFNVSGSDIIFSIANNLQVYQGTNGNPCANLPSTNITSGTLAANEVWVIGSSDLTAYANTNGVDLSGTIDFSFGFNGNDALELYLGGVLQDGIGTCGDSNTWSGSGVSAANQNIQIIDGLCDGDIDGWVDPSERFTQIAVGTDMTGFGNAPSSCILSCSYTISSFSPSEAPIGSEITIIGTGFTGSSTVNFNGTPASIVSQNATTIVATVPSGASNGSINITEPGCTESSVSDFVVLGAGGSCFFSDLIISEIYDAGTGGGTLGYIEVYNGTGATINLSDYRIDRYLNISDIVVSSSYNFPVLTILNDQVLFGRITTGVNVVTPDFELGGGGLNGNDKLELVHVPTSTVIDIWHESDFNNAGYTYMRNTNITGPNSTYTASEWTSSNPENATDLGIYSRPSVIPTINTQPTSITNCSSELIFVLDATGNGLITYQWKYYDTDTSSWEDLPGTDFSTVGTVSGETTNTLTITGYDLSDYQFYCEVTDASCSLASNAVQVNLDFSTWSSGAWDVIPTIGTRVILNENYDTSTGGSQISFEGCSLTVNTAAILTIEDSNYIRIQNNIIVDGEIIVKPQGSVVQVNNLATVTENGSIYVEKETAPLNTALEYTYWSSPVSGETIESALSDSNPNRRYLFNAQNYLDSSQETNNDNTAVPGQDDIDDDSNDWELYSNGTMTSGVGYSSTHSDATFSGPGNYTYVFEGPFNNGVITVPVYRNDSEINDINWNLIGNPYPSAIDANDFITANSSILDGAIYLWSHNTPASATTNGNEGANFAQSDYAIINGASYTDGGDMITPNGFIPSGQAFFISYANAPAPSTLVSGDVYTANVTFNNSMRKTGDSGENSLFFKNNNSINSSLSNKLWLNLTSDNGIFNQISIAYVTGATNAYDGEYYDARKITSSSTSAAFYSIINGLDKKFAIQGRATNSINENEIINVGFNTIIDVPTLYKLSIANLQGDFLTDNTIYLKDNLTNTVHDLSVSDYTFTSEVGEFNDRFEIVFNDNALTTENNNLNSDLTIIELRNDYLQLKTSSNATIKTVLIYDILGRKHYDLKGNSSSETYNLSNLKNTLYIVKVELSNGTFVTKKIIQK